MSTEITMLQLKNGYQVPLDTYNSLCEAGESLVNINDIYTIHSLVLKCQDANYKLTPSKFGDAKSTLKQYNLLDANDNVHEDIRQIVLNGIEETEQSLRVPIPLKNNDVVVIEIKRVK